MSIKLSKLPDRKPRKLTIDLSPDVISDLECYAEFYAEIYGHAEQPKDLVGPIIQSFLASDRGFVKAKKQRLTSEPQSSKE